MACEAFVHEDGLPVSRRMERREHGINRERGPPLGWGVLHRQTDTLVGLLHDWGGCRWIAEPYDIERACALILTWNWRPRRVGDFDCHIRDDAVVGVDQIARELRHEAVLRYRFHHGIGRNGNSFK